MSAALALPVDLPLEKSRHTTLTEEALKMARKLKAHMRPGRTGKIDFALRVNTLISFLRRERRNLTYVEWRPQNRLQKKRKLPDVHFAIWGEDNLRWWEKQRTRFSHEEGGRPIPDSQILNSLFLEGVPLLLESSQS